MVNTGDTAWILTSAALVLLMTPGLAFFYGGMVRAKSVLNMMMMSFGALGLISVLWVLYGYTLAFGDDVGAGLLGDPFQYLGLKGLMEDVTSDAGGLPAMAFVGFQAVFAIITVALISGAIADRAKFGSWMVFAGVWATIVYFPVAHWVFDFSLEEHVGGWIANTLKVIDFAGGTAVHINAGAAGLALALVLGKRRGFGREAMRPHNLTLVMIGAGLLWFGWFGFNAGSAVALPGAELPIAGTVASLAFANTQVAAAAAGTAWMLIEWMHQGKPTILGFASGMVAGLVVITPCAGHVLPWSSIVIGLVGGGVCYFGCRLKNVFKYDDSLDAFGVHGVGGALGALLVGIFAIRPVMGGGEQFMKQLLGVSVCAVFAFVLSFIIALIIHKTVGMRATEEQEFTGLDLSLHGERGYHLEDDMFAGAADTAEGHPDARGTSAVGSPTTAI